MMTIEGGKAAGIAKWAWQDPAGRVEQAISEVRELANTVTDPAALAEIQDAGTMLSRLASSVRRQPPPEPEPTIGDQLGLAAQVDSIFAQILLAHEPAWVHEKRGAHGEWARSGLAGVGARAAQAQVQSRTKTERAAKMAEARQQRLIQAEVARQVAAAKPSMTMQSRALTEIDEQTADKQLKAMPLLPGEDIKTHMNPLPGESRRENLLHEQLLHQRVAPYAETKAAQVLDAAKQHVAAKLAEAKQVAAHEEDVKSRHDALLKLATEGGVAIGGAVLAYIETRLGVPDLLALASSAGAMLVQILIEWRKRL